jgi:serine/threonine-protein kinase
VIGQTIAHYQIISKLAAGGMGSVYKAIDMRLARRVALKFLPRSLHENEAARARFILEAQTASALDHPNICTIYDIDETRGGEIFMAMAFYEGETISQMIRHQPLPANQAASIAAQVAEGLAAAHQHGIVHRDVKPANVVVTPEGQVKILDFGIAKLVGDSTGDDGLVGTAVYMSPEQLTGREVDHRSDIWSLGVLLFQMLAGDIPYFGDSPEEVLEAIRSGNREPLTVSEPENSRLARIFELSMASDPDHRYQDVAEMRNDLQAVATLQDTMPPVITHDRRVPSIAVLPFADHSPEQDQDYFCTGLAEEIIHVLTRVGNLRVTSRSSAYYSGKNEDLRLLGRQLRVNSVLEGSVRRDEKRLRIAARLVRTGDGSYLWSGRYDRELRDVFAVQEEIAAMIVEALKPALMEGEAPPQPAEVRTSEPPTESFDAYLHYLKGRYLWNKRTHKELTRGIEHFEEAILLESRYARAYAGLADSYAMLGIYGYMPPHDVMPLAKTAAERALAINDRLAEVYTSRACARAVYDWDFKGAGEDFRRAIELDPNYATAYQWRAMNYLIPQGRFAEAFDALDQASSLDPLSLTIATSRGLLYYYYRRFREAVEEFRKALEIDEGFEPAHVFLGQVYDQQGRYEEALEELQQASSISGGRPDITVALGHAHAQLGNPDQARRFLDDLLAEAERNYVSPAVIAQVHAALGEREAALAALARAREVHAADLLWIGVNPAFDPLHDEPAFRALLQEIGLEVHEPYAS